MDIGVLAWALSLRHGPRRQRDAHRASANVVGTSASAKGGYPIGWGRYCKYCVPATIIVMAVSTATYSCAICKRKKERSAIP